MTDHQSLLTDYVQTGSDAAFRELVSRYVDLVYSTALRLVGADMHCAEDVAQTVFADLARLAKTLPADVKLGGWLHRDTCFVAANLMRGERRRQSRERQAAEMNALQNHSEADYSLVAPILDEAINELGEADRTAILLRFFEQQDFRAVGQALGSNEDAARMRVTRALEKLEEFLKRRGITTTAASLGVVLTVNAVQAAPVGLAITISTAALLAGSTISTTVTATAIKTIAMTTLQKTVITATLAVVAGAGIYEARQASQLRDQIQTLQQQRAPLTEQLQQLKLSYDDATNRLFALTDDNERLNRNTSELLKLRNMVGILRDELETQKATKAKQSTNSTDAGMTTQKPGSYISKEKLVNAGFQTPEAALQTYFQAWFSGNYEHWVAAKSAQSAADAWDPHQREIYERGLREEASVLGGIQMLAKKVISDDRVEVEVMFFLDGKAPVTNIANMIKEGNEWKFAGTSSVGNSWGQSGQIQNFTPSAD